MKRVLSVLAALAVMVFLLTGCGLVAGQVLSGVLEETVTSKLTDSGEETGASKVPNSGEKTAHSKATDAGEETGHSKGTDSALTLTPGVYPATSCVMDGEEYGCDKDWLVIEAGGEGVLVFEGQEYAMTWELSGSEFFFEDEEGSTFEGTWTADGVIQGVLDDKIEYIFQPEQTVADAVSGGELEAGVYPAVYCLFEGEKCYCDKDWLELESDGKGILVFEGEEYAMTWELSGEELTFLVEEGSTFEGVWADGVIEGTLNGEIDYIFAPEGSQRALAAVGGTSAADMELGAYYATYCAQDGEEYYCDEDWLEIEADGKGILVFEGEELDISWALDGTGFTFLVEGGGAFEGTCANGVIEGDLSGYDYIFER